MAKERLNSKFGVGPLDWASGLKFKIFEVATSPSLELCVSLVLPEAGATLRPPIFPLHRQPVEPYQFPILLT
jgi:hypothetical protein